MKLAEALQARVDLNVRIQELRGRICDNALVQEGEKPQEDPKALLQNLEECLREWETLVSRINLTNCRTPVRGAYADGTDFKTGCAEDQNCGPARGGQCSQSGSAPRQPDRDPGAEQPGGPFPAEAGRPGECRAAQSGQPHSGNELDDGALIKLRRPAGRIHLCG